MSKKEPQLVVLGGPNGFGKSTTAPALLKGSLGITREAILRHKLAGNPIVEWRDGKVVWIPPEEIDVSEDEP